MHSPALGRIVRMLVICLAALSLAAGVSACGGGTETVTVNEGSESTAEATETEATDTETTESDTAISDTESGSSEEDEVNARAAVDALLLGVRGEDPKIVCGLLSEEYAKKLTGDENGIAKCVENLKNADLGSVKAELQGVAVETTEVAPGGDTATVTLTSNETVELMKDPDDPSRYVITAGLE